MGAGHKKVRHTRGIGRTFFEINYLEDVIGVGFDIGALGQQEAARNEAAAATTRSLAIFIIFLVGCSALAPWECNDLIGVTVSLDESSSEYDLG